MTDLSVIIVCYKGWPKLEKCLQSLESVSAKDFSFDVIVSDNTPDPNEILTVRKKFPRFMFIHNPVNGGFAYGSNAGASKASGKYLLFLNPDTVVSSEAIEKLLSAAESYPSYKIISCRQVNEKGKESRVTGQFPSFGNLTGFMRALSPKRKWPTDASGKFLFPDWVSGSVIMMMKNTFTSIGGFSEDYWMYYEDVDICKRVRDSGGRIALLLETTIEHNHGGSSRIDPYTAALTKTEVMSSRHIYISKHKAGAEKALIQTFLVINNLLTGLLSGIAGMVILFHNKGQVRMLMFRNLVRYYLNTLSRSSWISERSINYGKNRY